MVDGQRWPKTQTESAAACDGYIYTYASHRATGVRDESISAHNNREREIAQRHTYYNTCGCGWWCRSRCRRWSKYTYRPNESKSGEILSYCGTGRDQPNPDYAELARGKREHERSPSVVRPQVVTTKCASFRLLVLLPVYKSTSSLSFSSP